MGYKDAEGGCGVHRGQELKIPSPLFSVMGSHDGKD